jgi:hypothetical protein
MERIMDRPQAHGLLDQLDPGQFAAVGHLLEVMVDPVARALAAAPPDDEPMRRTTAAAFTTDRRGLRSTAALPWKMSSPSSA